MPPDLETLLLNWDPVREIAQAIRTRRDARFMRRVASKEVLAEVEPMVLTTRMDSQKYHRIEFGDSPRGGAEELQDAAA